MSQRRHTHITVAAHHHLGILSDVEGCESMAPRRILRETTDRRHISLSKLAGDYFITCDAEGKLPSAVRGYNQKLRGFVRGAKDATLSDYFSEVGQRVHLIHRGAGCSPVLATVKPSMGDKQGSTACRRWNLQNHVRCYFPGQHRGRLQS